MSSIYYIIIMLCCHHVHTNYSNEVMKENKIIKYVKEICTDSKTSCRI